MFQNKRHCSSQSVFVLENVHARTKGLTNMWVTTTVHLNHLELLSYGVYIPLMLSQMNQL